MSVYKLEINQTFATEQMPPKCQIHFPKEVIVYNIAVVHKNTMALRNASIEFKRQDVIFKTALLVPNPEVTD